MAERIKAAYIIETSFPLEKAVATMAGEQSSGTFVKVPGETAELPERFGAKVDFIRSFSFLHYLNIAFDIQVGNSP